MKEQTLNIAKDLEQGTITEPEAKNKSLGSLSISEVEEFFYDMGEDWHLWDEEEQGQYPVQRIFDAMKKFIDYHKSK